MGTLCSFDCATMILAPYAVILLHNFKQTAMQASKQCDVWLQMPYKVLLKPDLQSMTQFIIRNI